MNIPDAKLQRLRFLARIVKKEIRYLSITDQRLFRTPFTLEMASTLEQDVELAERIDAFVSRFGRLQDTVGDKLLPQYLNAVGESTAWEIHSTGFFKKIQMVILNSGQARPLSP